MPKTPTHPSPPPLEANDVAIVGGGTVLWFVAFVVLLPFWGTLSDHGRGNWPWICLAGGGLGLIGLWYCRARRDAIARSRAAEAAATTPTDAAGTANRAPHTAPEGNGGDPATRSD
ncbi:DUF2530 domain-containing protein [Kitasatospora purpeofusca]|uniref:DUF2530 domain-containing protein n=1 Tax=Kitasatospora purpeofusca TaxID=67352 RepID=UPI0022597478|nr:DUF2530 domain-containing protein [Kitasatospora purpeofusca]MCX4687195.1 DUF2530 domain-containing protein [Kitasatospora purpeofusca]